MVPLGKALNAIQQPLCGRRVVEPSSLRVVAVELRSLHVVALKPSSLRVVAVEPSSLRVVAAQFNKRHANRAFAHVRE